MAAAGCRTLYSLPIMQRNELGLRWTKTSVGRVGRDLQCSKRVSPIHHRLLKLPSSTASLSTGGRRRASTLKAQIQEGSKTLETEDKKAKVQQVSTSQGGKDDEGKWDLSWLPSFPHVATATMANFLFGYHIGSAALPSSSFGKTLFNFVRQKELRLMSTFSKRGMEQIINGPLDSIAKELRFEGDTLVEGFVVNIFIVGAFVGSASGGVLSDAIGRRQTFQIFAIPLVIGVALSATADSVEAMALGCLLVGVGIGVNTALVPLYVSEIAPTKFRLQTPHLHIEGPRWEISFFNVLVKIFSQVVWVNSGDFHCFL